MTKRSRLISYLKSYWMNKLEIEPYQMDDILSQGFSKLENSSPPQLLVATCSLQIAQHPVHKVIKSINMFTVEYVKPVFDQHFYRYLNQSIRELELAGRRSHAKDLQKIGRVIAAMHNADDWKTRWDADSDQRLVSAIRNEPFLPQKS